MNETTSVSVAQETSFRFRAGKRIMVEVQADTITVPSHTHSLEEARELVACLEAAIKNLEAGVCP